MNQSRRMEKNIPNIIKDIRITNKLTQKELGDILGVGRTTIVGYESGQIKPSMRVIDTLCDEFRISPRLFYGTALRDGIRELVDLESQINTLLTNIIIEKASFKDKKLSPSQRTVAINTLSNLMKMLKELE